MMGQFEHQYLTDSILKQIKLSYEQRKINQFDKSVLSRINETNTLCQILNKIKADQEPKKDLTHL